MSWGAVRKNVCGGRGAKGVAVVLLMGQVGADGPGVVVATWRAPARISGLIPAGAGGKEEEDTEGTVVVERTWRPLVLISRDRGRV